MNSFNLPDDKFYDEIEKMTLSELERFIDILCGMPKSGGIESMEYNHEKISACLLERKAKLRTIFGCTPENIERLHCVANLIKNRTGMLYKKGNELYRQMWQIWQTNQNEAFNDFYIELSIGIKCNDTHSILNLPDDNSGSDYQFMSEVLDSFYYDRFFIENLITNDTLDYDAKNQEQQFQFCDDDGKIDDWGEPWFFEQFPELSDLPITIEFHNLLFHSHYALQDIIRINDVWSEVKVVWQHIAGQEI